jgi:hypothetical protein
MRKFFAFLLIAGFLICLCGTSSAKLLKGTFIDTGGHWAENEIETAYNRGLMQGVGTDKFGFKVFAPEANVNRYQLAVVSDRAFDLDYGTMRFIKEPVASDYYSDLENEAWYSGAVTLAAINHIFASDGELKGEEEVSRIEAARGIYRAFQAKGISVPMIMLMPMYDDTTELAEEDVNAMVFVSNTGIMKGNNNLFRPYDPLTRAELARVLNQVVKLIEINPVEAEAIPDIKLEIKEEKSESQLINIDLNIPVIKGLKNEEIQSRLNLHLENDARERQKAMIKEAESNSDFILTEPYHTYALVSRVNQYYITKNTLSFYVDYYSFTGGAHGMTERKAYNLDLNTGEELSLGDFFAYDFDYTAMINEKVQRAIKQNPDLYFTGEYGFKGITGDQGFYLENNNLIVYFLQYEIAPYAAGIRTFAIPLQFINQNNDKTLVVKLIEDFGSKLKNVSLSAPDNVVKNSIQENYSEFVSPELLAKWKKDLQNIPGRVLSSPWPERIKISGMESLSDSGYQIEGHIIEMTSVEMVNGGVAARRPITVTAEKIENSWLITAVDIGAYDEGDSTVYTNKQYGFNFSLPDSWQGYSIVTDQWEGTASGSSQTVETGPMISIRHPQWTMQNQRQDIPIMVFTLTQWNSLQEKAFHIGAAPIGPRELGRNSQYIFALPARYNFAFPAGYEEVEEILGNNPLKPL